MSRPFGVALLLGGWDDNGPVLFHADPSGTFIRYDAKAIGSGSEGAQANLQESYRYFSFRESVSLILLFQEGHDIEGSRGHGPVDTQTSLAFFLAWH